MTRPVTVDEFVAFLAALSAQGHGGLPVLMWDRKGWIPPLPVVNLGNCTPTYRAHHDFVELTAPEET